MRVACLHFPEEVKLEKVAEDVLRFSPQIAIREPGSIFVEIGKCRKLYSEEEFLQRAAVLFRRLKLNVAMGLGDSIETALLHALYGSPDPAQLPVTALFELADPLNRDEKMIPFVDKLATALQELGIKTLQGFKAVPRRELAARFGSVGLLCRQKLDGELLTPWKPWLPPEVIAETEEYLYSDFQATLEPVLFETKKLLDRIFVRLRFRNLKAASLSIYFKCEKLSINPNPERTLKIDFLLPQSETKGTLAILRDFLAKEFDRNPLVTPMERFTITVTQSAPGFLGQKNLYHSREEKQEAYASFVSQLSQMHGKGTIFKARTVEERLPEYSWERVAETKKQADLRGRIPLRPTHLTKPQKVDITKEFVHIQKKKFRIRRWHESVERISSRWLDNLIDRTYFQVEVENGPLLWVFAENEVFYLHGYYG